MVNIIKKIILALAWTLIIVAVLGVVAFIVYLLFFFFQATRHGVH